MHFINLLHREVSELGRIQPGGMVLMCVNVAGGWCQGSRRNDGGLNVTGRPSQKATQQQATTSLRPIILE